MNNTIRVALPVDSILYAPLFSAKARRSKNINTPYGSIDIRVVGREDDMRFVGDEQKIQQTVDGYATLAVLFGYADVAICDPSFIIVAIETDDRGALIQTFEVFFDSLSIDEKDEFKTRKHPKLFEGDNIHSQNLFNFLKESKPLIVGALIDKVALSAVTRDSKESNAVVNMKGDLTKLFLDDGVKAAVHRDVDTIISPPAPATGWCVGELISYKQEINSARTRFSRDKMASVPFGIELQSLLYTDSLEANCDNELPFKLEGQESQKDSVIRGTDLFSPSTRSILKDAKIPLAITADYIGADILVNDNKIRYVIDFAVESASLGGILFSAVVTSGKFVKDPRLKSFLYCLDYEVTRLHESIKSGKASIIDYFNDMFHSGDDNYEDDFVKLMIADEIVEQSVTTKGAVRLFSSRLYEWYKEIEDRSDGDEISIYSNSLLPRVRPLQRMVDLRLRANSMTATENFNIDQYIDQSPYNHYGDVVQEIERYENMTLSSNPLNYVLWKVLEESKLLYFVAVFVVIQVLSLVVSLLDMHLLSVDDFLMDDAIGKVCIKTAFSLIIAIGFYLIIISGRTVLDLKRFKQWLK